MKMSININQLWYFLYSPPVVFEDWTEELVLLLVPSMLDGCDSDVGVAVVVLLAFAAATASTKIKCIAIN